jgi:hypothetical protein
MIKLKSIIVILLFVSQCSLYNLATEEEGFNKDDRPKVNEGIAVFIFKSSGKAPLPSEVFFQFRHKKRVKRHHFVLSVLIHKDETSRYVFLEKGNYSFTKMVYKFDGHIEEFYFPPNSFHISSSHINYIGDIIFYYNKNGAKAKVKDDMGRTMYDFYKRYKKIIVMYPKKKSLLWISSLDNKVKKLYSR